jgi:hypothetical protein
MQKSERFHAEIAQVGDSQRSTRKAGALERCLLIGVAARLQSHGGQLTRREIDANLRLQAGLARVVVAATTGPLLGVFVGQFDDRAVVKKHPVEALQQRYHRWFSGDDLTGHRLAQAKQEGDQLGCEALFNGLRRNRRSAGRGDFGQFLPGRSRVVQKAKHERLRQRGGGEHTLALDELALLSHLFRYRPKYPLHSRRDARYDLHGEAPSSGDWVCYLTHETKRTSSLSLPVWPP